MWQRPQTIYMAFSIMMLAAALFFPAFTGELPNGNWIDLYAARLLERNPVSELVVRSEPLYMMAVLVGVPILMVLTSIFLYKTRPIQVSLLWPAIAIQALAIVGLVFKFFSEAGPDALAKGVRGGVIFILTSIILDWIAIRLIKKDEKLVRGSRDRLR